jgi:uncharacterized protein
MKAIDAHVHVNRFDLMAPGPRSVIERNPTFPQMLAFMRDPDAFVAHLDSEGIDVAWLINYCARDVMGYGWEVNPWVAEYVAAHPSRLVAVGGYDPREDGDGGQAMDKLRDLGIRALKVHPVHQRIPADLHRADTEVGRRMAAAYARCEELRMPVIFHTGTSIFPGAANEYQGVAPIENVLADHPDLKVVLAHGGRPNETQQAVAILRKYPNARIDLSSCPPKRLPEYFGDLEALADRLVWGSDWPGPKVPGMGANVKAFLALGLSEGTNEAILRGNALRLLA